MAKDIFVKNWIIENSLEVVDNYDDGVLTLRALHYQLVSRGMTNDVQHYKRVVSAMIDARWSGLVSFEKFSDLDRSMVNETEFKSVSLEAKIEQAKRQLGLWMTSYYRNKWENQYYYPEILIEKKALQGVFQSVAYRHGVALGACKGYPSLTFLNEAATRYKEAAMEDKVPLIIYFGDYDPSGEDIPRSIQDNLLKLGVEVEVRRIALMRQQVIDMKLPPAPAKATDSRTANWDGLGQVELDAVRPEILQKMASDVIEEIFDGDLYDDLLNVEREEQVQYRRELQLYVNTLSDVQD